MSGLIINGVILMVGSLFELLDFLEGHWMIKFLVDLDFSSRNIGLFMVFDRGKGYIDHNQNTSQ